MQEVDAPASPPSLTPQADVDTDDEEEAVVLRFGDIGKFLSVLPGLVALAFLYVVYTFLHCLSLLQLDIPKQLREDDRVQRGWRECAVFNAVTAMVLYCLARTVVVHPGTIPNKDSRWTMPSSPGARSNIPGTTERKDGGSEPRYCKWCLKYKPDRCHHCRICCLCILRMDHHCPMVYNCIGFRNHKYFFLLLIYSITDLVLVAVTMLDSVLRAIYSDLSFEVMLALVAAEALALSLCVAMGYFLCFHVWLVLQGLTTLEYVERKSARPDWKRRYDAGAYRNICNVLGRQPLLWLFPASHPEGDGTAWNTADDASQPATS
mmetsp:Transcript_21657/g.50626  ORF Transcript_21657/g.50626 Transcript_21657/m.50626 type:complete len:320 (+) Transcript_21657:85-1044(+)